MVAPNKNQPLELSPSFSVKDAVGELHTKETVMTPLLEMEPESSTTDSRDMEEHMDMSASSSSSSANQKKLKANNNKKVTFCENVNIRPIPVLTQEEKRELFYNKQDKRNTKLELKRLVTYHRSSPNNFFFSGAVEDEIIQIPEEERTKIGLEAHINPQFKFAIRRRMTKLVLQHQGWHQQHPAFFDTSFLAQNCTTVAKSATQMALDRAQNVVKELARDKAEEAPIKNITVSNNNNNNNNKAQQEEVDESTEFSVRILCTPEPVVVPTTSATTTPHPAMETVVTAATKQSQMEAPGNSCMVR
eukprot:CAMPEP_0113616598 /NCGR_PEP_ID=MMETSP0017_2-20120614/8323_1 /TAXON_ID=2856 /ORGANISM="Cylindrotheca closterium" /LENGTH=302 /DNA_ID=CAMNT_0000525919 /DNA_START=92 /DNA_END=1000 /DNA_ORIENTATION=+ /assembly_acc=CAM_ASM_000147